MEYSLPVMIFMITIQLTQVMVTLLKYLKNNLNEKYIALPEIIDHVLQYHTYTLLSVIVGLLYIHSVKLVTGLILFQTITFTFILGLSYFIYRNAKKI